MKIPRQVERRNLFNRRFEEMPLWSTWVKKILLRVDLNTVKEVERGDFKAVPRRQRREMARVASKRDWAILTK